MTVYVDNFRATATVGRIRGRWSHLVADTEAELHAFALVLGLRRAWFQTCKRKCAPEGVPCPHWHYDVTDQKRSAAIEIYGATPITYRDLGNLIAARRRGEAWDGPTSVTSSFE